MPAEPLRRSEAWVNDEREDLLSECCGGPVGVEYGAALDPDITFRCEECGLPCDVEAA